MLAKNWVSMLYCRCYVDFVSSISSHLKLSSHRDATRIFVNAQARAFAQNEAMSELDFAV